MFGCVIPTRRTQNSDRRTLGEAVGQAEQSRSMAAHPLLRSPPILDTIAGTTYFLNLGSIGRQPCW